MSHADDMAAKIAAKQQATQEVSEPETPSPAPAPVDTISHRDAAERALLVQTEAEAGALLHAAQRQGDAVLGDELMEVARSRGWTIGIDAQIAEARKNHNVALAIQLKQVRAGLR